ncbi:hypothetical protein B0T17DRAFT_616549 [Bombardia bombarda]|uniref:Amidohydrolase n=1 Tax=Bombardia bombarda TaxID=252184 RepID=A0AA40CAC5_9PEZI|nr:hypothetical protein B0T17DRAFT_616549 [Bombardia bombarda]
MPPLLSPIFLALATATLAQTQATQPRDISTLPTLLQSISATVFPPLKAIAVSIWSNPELGLSEHHAHDLIVDHFTTQLADPSLWTVTPHAFGLPTAFKLESSFRPPAVPPTAAIPTIGFLAEYDALVGIGHACGHNHIALNGLAAASMTRAALTSLGIAARVVVIGTPDEENMAGKHTLLQAGAFDGIDVWFEAHPTSANAVQPMNARVNAIASFASASHTQTVRTAYEALVAVRDLTTSGLPGTSSSAVPVEEVGMFECNVVQGQISLGINGSSVAAVQATVSGILDSTYPGVTFTVAQDTIEGGVNLTAFGPVPLVLTIETFRALSAQPGVSFFLPGNTTHTELDIIWDIRSRYTQDLNTVLNAVTAIVDDKTTSITTDTIYPALEVTPFLPGVLIDLLKTAPYGSQTDWAVSTFAPASTDASWLQGAVVDPTTKALVGADRVVFHPNFNICQAGEPCAFNHEPPFRDVAGTDFSYTRTEVIARSLAHIAVELLNDPAMMANATAILGS